MLFSLHEYLPKAYQTGSFSDEEMLRWVVTESLKQALSLSALYVLHTHSQSGERVTKFVSNPISAFFGLNFRSLIPAPQGATKATLNYGTKMANLTEECL